jgi:hypothetical protein
MSSYGLLPNSSADPDYIYYNGTVISNNDGVTTGADPAASFSETRNIPILKDAKLYDVAVMKAILNGAGKNIPVLVPQIISGANINQTSYTISICFAEGNATAGSRPAVVATRNIVWRPENVSPSTIVPATALPHQQNTDYYYCYSYNHFVALINETLRLCYDDILNGTGGVLTTTLRCPTIEYDEGTRLFSFFMDTGGTANTSGAAPIRGTDMGAIELIPNLANMPNTAQTPYVQGVSPSRFPDTDPNGEFMFIGMNQNLENLLSNFDVQFYGLNSVAWNPFTSTSGSFRQYTNGVFSSRTSANLWLPENVIMCRNKSGTNIQSMIDPTTGNAFAAPRLNYIVTQDAPSTTAMWSPVENIVLTTSLIPVRNEFISTPVNIGENNSGQSSASSSGFDTILCDYGSDSIVYADDWKRTLNFIPTAQFLPVSLTGSHTEVKGVDFKIFWRDRLTGTLNPLQMPNTASASVRLCFRRRTLESRR